MPAEWEKHAATWLAFPHHRTDFPGKRAAVAWTFAEAARLIAGGERVRLLCRDAAIKAQARRVFGDAGVPLAQVDFVMRATNRSWLRDSLPLWVRSDRGLEAIKFRFDGWARYRDHKDDDAAGVWVAKKHGPVVRPTLPNGELAVLEGGSIDVDGRGTVLTTEECLLTSPRARFRGVSDSIAERRAIAEALLAEMLGARHVIWLGSGIVGDDTSGHVDDFARFVPEGRVVVCDEPNRKDDNHLLLKRAQKVLSGAVDARGRRLEVVLLPMPSPVRYRGDRLPASYANFYVCNAGVLVPLFNDPMDRVALDILAGCFKDRPTIGVYCRDLVLGLGTLHCSTMQQPEA
jgi:agmatine deiminase